MVLGLRTKNRKGASVQVDYLVHVQEIKPWPPSQSLRSLRSVLLQWENGDRKSGSTGPVVPSTGSGAGDGKIEFNESFRLTATLSREAPVKGGDAETFQKNCLEFSLYEPRRDKTGQLLGTVIIDLADYGIVKETVNIGAPMNCKRSFRNTAQPVLFVRIQPFENDNSSSLPKKNLSTESSLDQDGKESISALMDEEYADEAEVASFTEDDVSSHSSLNVPSSTVDTAGSSLPQNEKVPEKLEDKPVTAGHKHLPGSSCSPSIDMSSNPVSPENDRASFSNFHGKSLTSVPEKLITHNVQSSSSSIAYEGKHVEVRPSNGTRNYNGNDLAQEGIKGKSGIGSFIFEENQHMKNINTNGPAAKVSCSDSGLRVVEKAGPVNSANSHAEAKDNRHFKEQSKNGTEEAKAATGLPASLMEDGDGDEQGENGQEEQIRKEQYLVTEDESSHKFSLDVNKKQVAYGGDTLSYSRRALGVKSSAISDDRLRHLKSVRSSLDSPISSGSLIDNNLISKLKETDTLKDVDNRSRSFMTDGGKDTKLASRDTRNSFSDGKVQQLERRIERLEGELREAAAIEIGLYSVVAEHGSSASKVHAPARRLSRLYFHALRKWSPARIAGVARTAVSGLVLVAKACGNDVPRLTFWLSNSIVLRAVISQAIDGSQLPISSGPHLENNGGGKGNNGRSSSLKWESSPNMREKKVSLSGSFDDWEDPRTFTAALEKFEAWIFSRIIESIWWQTLTPHMQSTTGKVTDTHLSASSRKGYGRRSSLGDQDQGSFSLELWKKAFKDACERLCPVRAGGHQCGCLPVLARLVMEQCVARLDVAMFNAILRESGDEIPTDPVSDPISYSKVLPIPAGKASFGAGAQLKNAIGNWSRWLTDLFGIDDDDFPEGENEFDDDDRQEYQTTFKSFNLLYALSDLMMLPKDMLLNSDIRKEVYPTFGAPLIRRVLNSFVPDEFCPDPIPEALFETLDSEDALDVEEQSLKSFPCTATPIVYSPPSATSLAGFIGELGSQSQLRRSVSSVLRKSYTSDDELDELDSPLASIISDSFRGSTSSTVTGLKQNKNGGHTVVRYQLLREVWRDGD
ncbi:uncharacterized protein LOC122073803 [Macadamia integrifolia]|uniref:uncharacterized protein LOC122073803 n=1 Tax=Macadamia integrifolia TaxID=60698 RepID=UPI001C4FC3D2|nr:uncharacterized protein LOC122073803 [Macadamia integrifolia]XP_042494371.1 uncharacterized protein LOC122073803 [Macadamia integrifolia]XP_042494372.1 uncharacterized protein LOC122073803 [Macadamia integrifolia]XP_042494373.1 uncharacterized protein LOC122073803 [Macadamia integrifolia]XP_042494375.1 uncharacterized protein LOC122073803 [Macadamia integrifolia]